MWWNNVETKPGTGYPTLWEDQKKYGGGWEKKADKVRLRMQTRLSGLANIFFNPFMPTIDDYYEPWTYRYEDLFNAPLGEDQPTARPISMITNRPIEIEAGPNWDDDFGGSPLYAASDPNLKVLNKEERQQLFEIERMVFFYLPRICNHCLNPSCLAACPAGAIYKRGEDGIVLINQEKCRAWRMCVSGCPYKKVYYNWATGKSEKCILCYPRMETGQAPACFHSCVGRIRYVGVLFYDADRIEEVARGADERLVELMREIILDPFDPKVISEAEKNGIHDGIIQSAKQSPVYLFFKKYKMALPLHPEFRTVPMLFYIPSLLPVAASTEKGTYEAAHDYFSTLESLRIPLRYMASLFAAGNEAAVTAVYKKLMAVRIFRRARALQDIAPDELAEAMTEGETTPEEAEAIFRLTSLSTFEDRFRIPPLAREMDIEALGDPQKHKTSTGFGFRRKSKRW
jgi:nitrate reductase beta subunit